MRRASGSWAMLCCKQAWSVHLYFDCGTLDHASARRTSKRCACGRTYTFHAAVPFSKAPCDASLHVAEAPHHCGPGRPARTAGHTLGTAATCARRDAASVREGATPTLPAAIVPKTLECSRRARKLPPERKPKPRPVPDVASRTKHHVRATEAPWPARRCRAPRPEHPPPRRLPHCPPPACLAARGTGCWLRC